MKTVVVRALAFAVSCPMCGEDLPVPGSTCRDWLAYAYESYPAIIACWFCGETLCIPQPLAATGEAVPMG